MSRSCTDFVLKNVVSILVYLFPLYLVPGWLGGGKKKGGERLSTPASEYL